MVNQPIPRDRVNLSNRKGQVFQIGSFLKLSTYDSALARAPS